MDEEKKEEQESIPREIPILTLRNMVVFPHLVLPIHVTRDRSLKAIEDANAGNRLIGLVTQKDESVEEPGEEDVYSVGTVAHILRTLSLAEGGARILVQGLARFKIAKILTTQPYFRAQIELLQDLPAATMHAEALVRSVNNQFRQYVNLGKTLPSEVVVAANNTKDPGMLADLVASNIEIPIAQRQEILEAIDQEKRLERLTMILSREVELLNMSNKIQSQVQEEVTRSQREYFLREQLRVIQKELGETDAREHERQEYTEKILVAKMPPDVQKKAEEEVKRLERMHPESAESAVIRTYLDTLCGLPWAVESKPEISIHSAEKILNDDHYGLTEIKTRLLEFLGVLKMRKTLKGPILCFVGPPGVGKTSIGRSVARAMGRNFFRMSLGGIRDEAEIRGHRRTYVGALPGRIVQGIKTAGTRNPVFMLDEIDKVGMDFRGDPSSALLEALDPEQNFAFSDHYLEVPFDLSHVLFIATANILDTVPPALRDRMEVITISGYTELEKVKIARGFLVPKQFENHGLTKKQLDITDAGLKKIVLEYTMESGVRNLEREIAKICRKAALGVAKGKRRAIKVDAKQVEEYLGTPMITSRRDRRVDEVGVATGVAWTAVGGDTLRVEASYMKGTGQLLLTGHLGDIMQESAKAALTYARSNAKKLGLDEEVFSNHDLHIHIPEGAIPKDGPSAGVTLATAMISLFLQKPVDSSVAMTGEITLKGRILPIGGLKEKLLAARRDGIKTVIIPKINERNLDDVPKEILKDLKIVTVDSMSEVVRIAIGDGKRPTERRLEGGRRRPGERRNKRGKGTKKG